MDTNVKVSVIVPIYNVEKYIHQCVDSILNQTLKEIEVILVDDGSPDRCGEICDEYANQDERVKVIHKENAGVAAARNSGIAIAQGEWMAFIDSDDWLEPDMFERAYDRGEMHHPDIVFFDGFQNFPDKTKPWNHFQNDFVTEEEETIKQLGRAMLYFPMSPYPTGIPLAAPWDKIYKTSFIRENNLHFTEHLKTLDDMVFNMHAFYAAKKVCYLKRPFYHYRMVPTSITNAYKPNRVELDCITFREIKKFVKEQKDGKLQQAFYARVIKSFSICCRLCFFNKQNEKPLKEKLRYVSKILKTSPYAESFTRVHVKNLEFRLKMVWLCARLDFGLGLFTLYQANTLAEKLMGVNK